MSPTLAAIVLSAAFLLQAAEPAAAPAPAAKQPGLSLQERVAQLMLVTLEGIQGPNNDDRVLLKKYTPGGVLIPLASQPRQAAEYIQELRKNPLEAKGIPLLIGTDIYSLTRHDSKIASGFIQIPTMLSVAAASDVPATQRLANLIADHLTVMGFNMNLGPSFELSSPMASAAVNLATFGADAAFAADAGCAMLDVFKTRGLLPVPMGFPGGGANRQKDGPATLVTPASRLDTQDLLPYRKAVDAGIKLLHVGPTLAPGLDPSLRPACLSAPIMRDLLRTKWNYTGVIMAGPIDSPDVTRLYDPAEAAVLALQAGADILYWSRPGEQVRRAMERIALAINDGTLSQQTIDAAVLHVLELKASGAAAVVPPDPGRAASLAKKNKYPKEAYEIEGLSITLLKNNGNILPLTKEKSFPMGVTGVAGVSQLREALEEHIKPVFEQPIRTAAQLGDIEDFEITRLTAGSGMKTAICVLTDMARMQGQTRLIRELKKSGMNVVIVALGSPANLPYYAEADAILAVYCQPAQCDASIKALADALVGKGPVRIAAAGKEFQIQAGKPQKFDVSSVVKGPAGRLPVAIDKTFPAGLGLCYDPAALLKKAQWDFGDGENAKGLQVEHTYPNPGQYTLSLTVTTQQGEETTGTFTISVK